MTTGRRNRIAPDGSFHAVAERGGLFGNRGALLGASGDLVRPFDGTRWIVCVLDFKGRRREQWRRGAYTELYFLDEATALAAGHRPCAECRRPAFEAFRTAWCHAFDLTAPPRATEMDAVLHSDRLVGRDRHRTFEADVVDLPDGAVVRDRHGWWLVDGPVLREWSFGGYRRERDRGSGPVTVQTPRATVEVLRAGYRPELAT
jgi:hypothetical protein